MNKILVCLEVPSISQSYELYVPDFLTVRELIPLLVKAVKELSDSLYAASECVLLCAKEQNVLLDEKATLFDYAIGHGDHLVMI